MNIRPLRDQIVAIRIERKDETVGGLIIPDAAQEKSMMAKVIAVGPGQILETGSRLPLEVEIHADVLVGNYAGVDVELDGVNYLILREEDVLGVVA